MNTTNIRTATTQQNLNNNYINRKPANKKKNTTLLEPAELTYCSNRN
jgi:hypothetical protein